MSVSKGVWALVTYWTQGFGTPYEQQEYVHSDGRSMDLTSTEDYLNAQDNEITRLRKGLTIIAENSLGYGSRFLMDVARLVLYDRHIDEWWIPDEEAVNVVAEIRGEKW